MGQRTTLNGENRSSFLFVLLIYDCGFPSSRGTRAGKQQNTQLLDSQIPWDGLTGRANSPQNYDTSSATPSLFSDKSAGAP